MVQQYQSPVRVYKYPFELVMEAYERRFPRCPQIPVVLDCEITEEKISEDGANKTTQRKCKLNVEAPYILKKLIGVDFVYFIQTNELNRRERSLYIEAYNESFANRVVVIEKCRYFVHPENSDWTCFEQSASLDIKNFFGFEHTMEKLAMKQYSQNIAKGKEIIEYFVRELEEEGVVHVPRWSEPEASTSRRRSSLEKKDKVVQFQLETEYIARYLGDLTVLQESRLVQLRACISDLVKCSTSMSMPSDATLLRFLRARDFNVDKAKDMLTESLLWRNKHQVDHILATYEMPQVVQDYFPGGWHHQDKDGRPLYLLRLGQMDVKGLLKSIGEDGLLKLTLVVCEEGLRRMEAATEAGGVGGTPVCTWSLLVDLEGLNMRHVWRPGVAALLRIISAVEHNYPETLGRVLILRAPRVFPILWTLVSTFIHENTRHKFLFYTSPTPTTHDTQAITDYIPDNYVPDFLGGPCKSSLVEGNTLIPKSLYMVGGGGGGSGSGTGGGGSGSKWLTSEAESEEAAEAASMYQSVSLGRGQVHEVLVDNADPGSLLTWDFDVMRQDIAFTVYRTQALPTHTHTAGSGSGNTGALQTIQLMMEQEHKSVIDKTWKENQHYYKVEPTIICHDGESIQGSHVMGYCGTYILQWKFYCDRQLDLIDSSTGHKAQVMFFYEMLCSADYKGSMTSLQSANSGFSALSTRSLASSCPSR